MFKATLADQASLLGDPRFRPSKFGARHGWTSMRVDAAIDWATVAAPYRDRGADVEIHATPHITRILQLLDIHRLPQLHLSCRGVRANTL